MVVSYPVRLLITLLVIVCLAVAGFFLKQFFTPESFGVYGHYRADAIEEEAMVPIRHGTNASCIKCHAFEAKIHGKGRHHTISCEFCHGPFADHVADNKKIGRLPVKKGDQITSLCLRCHNTEIKARSEQVIRTVAMPDHLKAQAVKLTHNCGQCHHVHAPLKYINRARQITGMAKAGK